MKRAEAILEQRVEYCEGKMTAIGAERSTDVYRVQTLNERSDLESWGAAHVLAKEYAQTRLHGGKTNEPTLGSPRHTDEPGF